MSDYTELSALDVGAALLGWIAATTAMRHASPRGGLDYLAVEDGTAGALVRDFVASACGHPGLVPGCRDRLHALGMALLLDETAGAA